MQERVEILGHYENGPGTADAASAGSVGARLLENRPILRTGEILELVPGVVITQHSGEGKANQYFVRGFNLDHGTDFATWVAGMPVNMPSHAHGQGYSDLNFLIPELVRRIDYFKGPYYAREGDFSSAGGARIALVDRLAANRFEATVGENGFRRGLLAASSEIARGSVVAALDVAGNDGPWVHPEQLHRWSGIARFAQGSPGQGWSLTAMGYESKWNATDQIPSRATIGRFDAIDPSDGGETSRYSLSGDYAAEGFTLSAYAIRSRLDLFSNFTYFLARPEQGDQFEQAEARRVLGGEARRRWVSTHGPLEVSHSAGLQFRRDHIDPLGLYESVARVRTATTREDRVAQSSVALYYETSLRWGEALRGIAGLRHDRYRFGVAGDDGGRTTTTRTSPKASLVFAPSEAGEFFANWGRGFHSNDARGLGRVTPIAPTTGAELGARFEPLPRLQTSLALWRLDLDSELVFVGDAGTTAPSRASRRHGIEWNSSYTAARHLLVDAAVAKSRARFVDDDPAGPYVPGAVETVASLGIALTDVGPWSGTLNLRHFGPRPLVADGSVRSRATTLLCGRVAYGHGPWRLSLDAFNLLDRKTNDIDYFYVSRLPGEAAEGVPDRHFHPAEPRTLRLTLTLRL